MTVAAARCVSGELIISVCRPWWRWSCDTRSRHTVAPFWCWNRRCSCMGAYVFVWGKIHLKCFAYNRETLTLGVVQLSLCSACGTCACVYTLVVPRFDFVKLASNICLLSLRQHRWCGVSARLQREKGGEGESEMASGEIEQNERRQEERWRDDQINHVGHFTAVRKGLIYPPPLCPHGQKANFSSAIRQQCKQQWLCEL